MKKKSSLKDCWEIMKCERHGNGQKVHEFGECVASVEGMGHTCWAIKGTICGGTIQGTMAEKESSCKKCEVYQIYHRGTGTEAELVKKIFPDEEKRYQQLLMYRIASCLG